MTPFISFFSLAAIALVAERLLAWRYEKPGGRRWIPIALRRLVRSLEEKLPRGAMVFEIPSSTFASTAGLPPCGATTASTFEWIGDASTPFEQQRVSAALSDSVEVTGWAVDERSGGDAGDVDVIVGDVAIPAFYGGDRSDVATALQKDAYRQSGFVARLSGKDLRPFAYPLSIRILAAERTCYYEGATVSILVR